MIKIIFTLSHRLIHAKNLPQKVQNYFGMINVL